MINLLAYAIDTCIYIGIFAIIALSLNLEYGFTGIVNFGKAAFVLIGAYVTSILMLSGLPFLPSLMISMALAGFAGFLISLFTLRLKGDYFAIVSLVFAEGLRVVLKNELWIAGGPLGIKGIPSAIPIDASNYEAYLLGNLVLIYTSLGLFFALSHFLLNSPYGRILRAIREDELLARTLGKDTFLCKIQIVTISSAISAAAGGLLAQYIGYVNPGFFLPATMTFSIWAMSILGGHSTIMGALLGAALVRSLGRAMRVLKDYCGLPLDPNNLMYVLSGILMMLVLLFRPEGMLKEGPIKTVKVMEYEGVRAKAERSH
ncbi:MAG: branched-chain amino acid ABC transporter permease [Thermoprotei archaeon]|nr:branched-chain amino acid ABC transporter permease [Thermoprotei archaeon]